MFYVSLLDACIFQKVKNYSCLCNLVLYEKDQLALPNTLRRLLVMSKGVLAIEVLRQAGLVTRKTDGLQWQLSP
jgi:hypothetical protein